MRFLLGGCLLAFGWDAQACGDAPPRCDPPVRLFPYNPYPVVPAVPANLIYFKVLVDDPGKLTLRTADGTVIPASIITIGNDRVFTNDVRVDSGLDLELEYTTVCPAGLEPEQVVYSVSTTDSMKLKLRSPSLEVYEQGVRYPGLANNEAVFTTLNYYTPAADSSAPHLMDHHVTVDSLDYRFGGENLLPTIDIPARCLPEATEPLSSCGYISWFGTGVHHVVAWSTVVGETSEPEKAELDVNLDCSLARAAAGLDGGAGESSGAAGTPGVDGSAGESHGAAGASSKPANDAGARAGSSNGGGCSLSRTSHGAQQLSFAGLLGVGLLFRRLQTRRRRRQASSAAS